MIFNNSELINYIFALIGSNNEEEWIVMEDYLKDMLKTLVIRRDDLYIEDYKRVEIVINIAEREGK